MDKHSISYTTTEAFVSPSDELSEQEVFGYFKFLSIKDEDFRGFYNDFPDIFKAFTISPDFSKLKSILGEKYSKNIKYQRKILCGKQKFIVWRTAEAVCD